MLIRGAEVGGRGPVDVRIAGERIGECGTGLRPHPGEEVLEADGGALLPGLHDHHIHLFALAAARSSVRCGPPEVRSRGDLELALRAASPRAGWLRGVGYHESVAGWLDRHDLDALAPKLPVRVQHRGGALWILNSPAVERLGLDAGADAPGVERDERGRATGRLFRLDAWLRERLGAASPPDLGEVGRRLAAFGVTGVTDASVGNGEAERCALSAAVEAGALRQRLHLMGGDALSASSHPLVTIGPRKVMLDDAALPELATLLATVVRAHARGRRIAVHCVTRAELVFALAAFREAGAFPGDRIEHASVAPPELLEQIAALPLTVVTQPNFVRERGDAYLAGVEPADRPWLYRAKAFRDAGVPLGGGCDAPFGYPAPGRAMRAAVERRTEAGARLGPEEAVTPETALALFTSPPDAPGGPPRSVAPGAAADLCLLDRPWQDARGVLASEAVRATWSAGECVWRAD